MPHQIRMSLHVRPLRSRHALWPEPQPTPPRESSGEPQPAPGRRPVPASQLLGRTVCRAAVALTLLILAGWLFPPPPAAAQTGHTGPPPGAAAPLAPQARPLAPFPASPEATALAQFADSVRAWKGLPEDELRSRARRFFRPYGVDDVRRLCRSAGEGEGSARLAKTFLQAMLTGDPLPARDLALLIGDPSMGHDCHEVLVKHVGQRKESYQGEDAELLADAFLRLADGADYPVGIRNQLEMAAATLSREDAVLERIRTYAASSAEDLQLQALRMMNTSRDPRATAELLDYLAARAREKRLPPTKALIETGLRKGPQAYDPIARFLPLASLPEDRANVLIALSHTQDLRALPLVLHEFGDSLTGIQIREKAEEEERSRYFQLWRCVRVLEPVLATALTGPSAERRRQAIELLDRSSRLGPAAEYEATQSALARSEELEPAMRQRIVEIRQRFDRSQQEFLARER